ncbi:hypothetical protein Acr_00g0057440 [Actinidia rufa]|uniref:Retrotransposon gag domain-containing protein n=1 Tax=Actinidia rufa TaxID=165716 RepID=A0A7J0DMI8_9ERIC|nr:hypothetical protein Acr_00g0057440 [Actinidia rufa]
MGPKRGRARMASHGRGGCGVTGQGTPVEDQGIASQTQQGGDRGATSRSRRTQQGAGRGKPNASCIKEFRKINPPSFDGLGDPVVAGHWLSQIRKIFYTVRLTEDDMKVSFASYQLVGEANEWWESIKEAKGVDCGMTWADFESTFEDQYFPESYRDELREQFEKLVQGGIMVSEYAIKFQSLSRFAPDLVNTEAKKCKRRVEPKKEQRKEFKGSWELRQMSMGTSSTTFGKFQQEKTKR